MEYCMSSHPDFVWTYQQLKTVGGTTSVFLFVLDPGSGFGALGLGVGAWAEILRDIKMN